MIKQNFYLKSDKINTIGEYPIFLKLSYKGNSTTLSTGKWITKERWKSTNKLKNPLRIDKEKNCKLALDKITMDIEMKYLEDKLEALDIYFAPKKESEKWVVILGAAAIIAYLGYAYLLPYTEDLYKKSERSKKSIQKSIPTVS